MTRPSLACALTILLAAAPVPAQPADKETAAADSKWLVDTWAAREKDIERSYRVTYPSGHLGTAAWRKNREESAAQLEAVASFEAELPAIRERMNAIQTRWGGGKPYEVSAAMAKVLGKKPKELDPAGRGLDYLSARIEARDAWREKARQTMVEEVDAELGSRVWLRYGDVRAALELANRLSPSPAIAARIAAWPEEEARHRAEGRKKVEAQAAPGHIKNFSGPGSADDLARSTIEFLRAPDDYAGSAWFLDHEGPWTFHAAVVREQWSAEETVVGRVTQWSLLLEVTLSDAEMEKDGVAAVVPFRMVCAKQAEKASGWVQGSWNEDAKKRVYVRLPGKK